MFSEERSPCTDTLPLMSPAAARVAKPNNAHMTGRTWRARFFIFHLELRIMTVTQAAGSTSSKSKIDSSHKSVRPEELRGSRDGLLPAALVFKQSFDVGADQDLEAGADAVARETLRKPTLKVHG